VLSSFKWFENDLDRYPSVDKVFKGCYKVDEEATTVLALVRERGKVHAIMTSKNSVLKNVSQIVQVGQNFALKKTRKWG